MISIGRIGFLGLLIVRAAYCTKSQAGDSVVGSWRLVSVEMETKTKSVHNVFGDDYVYA
jgi:hypothetical protein